MPLLSERSARGLPRRWRTINELSSPDQSVAQHSGRRVLPWRLFSIVAYWPVSHALSSRHSPLSRIGAAFAARQHAPSRAHPLSEAWHLLTSLSCTSCARRPARARGWSGPPRCSAARCATRCSAVCLQIASRSRSLVATPSAAAALCAGTTPPDGCAPTAAALRARASSACARGCSGSHRLPTDASRPTAPQRSPQAFPC